jgi:hypothetical protein
MAETSQRRLWYVRRAGRVRGPFPPGQISREVLLGRIRGNDELSHDRESWRALTELPELVPETLRHAAGPDAGERLMLARLREDERGRERRAGRKSLTGVDRRRGDRRTVESFEAVAVRSRRAQRAAGEDTEERNLLLPAAVVLTIVFSLAMYFFWYRPAVPPPARDCQAAPAPAVNWSGCGLAGAPLARADLREADLGNANLSGADLQGANLLRADLSYANLENAGLRGAQLREANLTGTLLRGANLATADLRDANLGYAILEGARLEGVMLAGARLDKAIWPDGRVCAPDSIGECR